MTIQEREVLVNFIRSVAVFFRDLPVEYQPKLGDTVTDNMNLAIRLLDSSFEIEDYRMYKVE